MLPLCLDSGPQESGLRAACRRSYPALLTAPREPWLLRLPPQPGTPSRRSRHDGVPVARVAQELIPGVPVGRIRIPVAIPAVEEIGSARGVAGDVDGVAAVVAVHEVGALAADDVVARGPAGGVLGERLGRRRPRRKPCLCPRGRSRYRRPASLDDVSLVCPHDGVVVVCGPRTPCRSTWRSLCSRPTLCQRPENYHRDRGEHDRRSSYPCSFPAGEHPRSLVPLSTPPL